MEREARETRPRASVVTCQGCGAVNLVEANGVPKIQCNGCGKVLVARAALPRTESR